MLMGIPKILSPELVEIMMEMGHGDELVLGDGNFPAAANAKRLVRCDGLEMVALLDAVLRVYPVDTYGSNPVSLMEVVPGDPCVPVIWEQYKRLLRMHTSTDTGIELLERYEFYERSKQAYAIVATGESAQYANMILRKGVVL